MASADPSSVRFAMIAEGSRGDVQPYVALALYLQKRGNTVQVFTNVNHVPFVESFGLKASGVLYDIQKGLARPDVRKALESGAAMAIQKSLAAMRLDSMVEDLKAMFEALNEFKPTVLGYGSMSFGKALMYSIDKEVPALAVQLQVMLPMTDKAPAGLPNLPCGCNRAWFSLIMLGAKKSLPVMHQKANEALGINFSDRLRMEYFNLFCYDIPATPAPNFYGISTTVIPRHPEWPTSNFNICGFFTIDRETQEGLLRQNGGDFGADTHDELTRFLQAGAPPVYVGFGSMLCKSAEFMSKIAIEGLKHAGARGVVCGGWAGMSLDTTPAELHAYCRENVLFVMTAPHEVIFPQCACVVHHGGSGTTAASVRSGRPTVILPLMGDQFDFADGISAMNCGVGLPQFSKVTGVQLGGAIKKCLEDENLVKAAKQAGEKLRAENGCENFARAFDEWYTSEVPTGKWLEKHNSIMEKSKAAARAEQAGSCSVQ